MARKTTKTKKATKSKATKTAADYTAAATKSASDFAKSYTKAAKGTSYDFSSFTKNFTNPSQFFNLGALQNLQPANFQAVIEQVIETSQKNMETWTACAQYCAERAKETIEENTAFTAKLIQEAATTCQDAFSGATTSDPREKLEEISELAKTYLEKAAKQAKKTAETNIETATKVGDQLKKRLTASVEELRSAA
jgi:hypothetical protein